VGHVLATSDDGFDTEFERLADQWKTTAVFDGVGGELISRIAPHLPMNATVSFYGFLAGSAPVSVSSALFMTKNLVMKSSATSAVRRSAIQRACAMPSISCRSGSTIRCFKTRIGKTFSLDQIHEAMACETAPGQKAILLTKSV